MADVHLHVSEHRGQACVDTDVWSVAEEWLFLLLVRVEASGAEEAVEEVANPVVSDAWVAWTGVGVVAELVEGRSASVAPSGEADDWQAKA